MPFKTAIGVEYATAAWSQRIRAVYGIVEARGALIYLGQAGDLNRRIAQHRGGRKKCIGSHAPAQPQRRAA